MTAIYNIHMLHPSWPDTHTRTLLFFSATALESSIQKTDNERTRQMHARYTKAVHRHGRPRQRRVLGNSSRHTPPAQSSRLQLPPWARLCVSSEPTTHAKLASHLPRVAA